MQINPIFAKQKKMSACRKIACGGGTVPTAIVSVFDKGYRCKFNGKKTDNETGLQDYGFRIYNPSLGKFLSVNPLSKDYPWNSTYAFAENQVINCVDLDGLEAYAVYNKASGKIALIPELKLVNLKLPFEFVSAIVYAGLTLTQKSQNNYGILITDVFTGGIVSNETGDIKQTKPQHIPIPIGNYNLLDNIHGKHPEFFVLDPVDDDQYDNQDDRDGMINSEGNQRDGYNFHPGVESWGCATINNNKLTPDATDADKVVKKMEWSLVSNAIKSTSGATKVSDNQGNWKYIPGKRDKYGSFSVINQHTVFAGETLSGIAKNFFTTVGKLTEINKIKNPNKINVGQTINLE